MSSSSLSLRKRDYRARTECGILKKKEKWIYTMHTVRVNCVQISIKYLSLGRMCCLRDIYKWFYFFIFRFSFSLIFVLFVLLLNSWLRNGTCWEWILNSQCEHKKNKKKTKHDGHDEKREYSIEQRMRETKMFNYGVIHGTLRYEIR